jgi:hypothetical protein
MGNSRLDWNREEIGTLIRLWNEGQLAYRIGTAVDRTEEQVLEKAKELGLFSLEGNEGP